jgi:DNA mismatch endonuclease (patch repair protein)
MANRKALKYVSKKVSARMRRVRRSGTSSELKVRELVARSGMQTFEINCKDLPGSPDLASLTGGWVIFVHGCFWHGHKGCAKATIPKKNRSFWLEKFEANGRRDTRFRNKLRHMGFRVLTLWECQTSDEIRLTARLRAFFEHARVAKAGSAGHS